MSYERQTLNLTTLEEVDEYAAQHMWALISATSDKDTYVTPGGLIVEVYYASDEKVKRVCMVEGRQVGAAQRSEG